MRTALGKPKDQYGASTWIIAKRRQPRPVAIVPSAVIISHGERWVSQYNTPDAHNRYIAGTRPAMSPTTDKRTKPVRFIGMSLIVVSKGV